MSDRVAGGVKVIVLGAVFVIFGMLIGAWLQLSFSIFAGLNTSLGWVMVAIIIGTAVAQEAKEILLGGLAFSAVVAIFALVTVQYEILAVAILPWVVYGAYNYLRR
jgi:hypothetical protein